MLYIEDESIGHNLDYRMEENSNIVFLENQQVFETNISTESIDTYKVSLSFYNIPNDSKVFIIDKNSNAIIGPFYINSSKNEIDIGPIHSSDFIIQCILPGFSNLMDYSIKIKKISLLEELQLDDERRYYKIPSKRNNPVIVITGFWPPNK